MQKKTQNTTRKNELIPQNRKKAQRAKKRNRVTDKRQKTVEENYGNRRKPQTKENARNSTN